MGDLLARLRAGTVQRPKRWTGDTHGDLGGTCDEEATDALMVEAADEIERLRSIAAYLLSMVDHAQKHGEGFDPEDLAEIEKARAWLGEGR